MRIFHPVERGWLLSGPMSPLQTKLLSKAYVSAEITSGPRTQALASFCRIPLSIQS